MAGCSESNIDKKGLGPIFFLSVIKFICYKLRCPTSMLQSPRVVGNVLIGSDMHGHDTQNTVYRKLSDSNHVYTRLLMSILPQLGDTGPPHTVPSAAQAKIDWASLSPSSMDRKYLRHGVWYHQNYFRLSGHNGNLSSTAHVQPLPTIDLCCITIISGNPDNFSGKHKSCVFWDSLSTRYKSKRKAKMNSIYLNIVRCVASATFWYFI